MAKEIFSTFRTMRILIIISSKVFITTGLENEFYGPSYDVLSLIPAPTVSIRIPMYYSWINLMEVVTHGIDKISPTKRAVIF